ncbi:MAG: magnesium transporter CorA family protein [Chloroflexota bacterium]|nr:magnesium transporter CorA family protein [Chloroflexota bacterium]MDQ5867240.1 magnesium transporter CorA family protein [Chloroflexota bacterium]
MLTSLLRDENNQFLVVQDIEAISDIVQNRDRLLWLDLERPSLAEFQLVQEEFGLHPLAIEDAMARHPRPKIDQYDHFYLMVFYLVSVAHQNAATSAGEDNEDTTASTGIFRPGVDGGPEFHSMRAYAPDAPAFVAGPASQGGATVQTGPAAGLGVGLSQVEAAASMDANPVSDRISLRELTLFMGENYLITVHNSPLPELAEVARRWRQNVALIAPRKAAATERPVVPGCRRLSNEERANLETRVGLAANPLTPSAGADMGVSIPVAPADEAAAGSTANRAGRVYRRSRNGQNGRAGHQGEIGILLYSLLDTIVDNYFPVVDSIVDRVEDLETEIFEHYNQKAIESIFSLKKDLLGLRKVLAPERDVLNILVRRDLPIFDQQTLLYFQDLYDHIVRITESVDTYRDLLSSALDSYLSMQSNRLNITVQTLTSLSIILMSVAAVAGWYGMNFAAMPELTSRFGYPGVMLGVVLLVIAEVIFFKRKGWL